MIGPRTGSATLHEAVATVRDLRRSQIVAAARRILVTQGIEALTFSALERGLSFTRGSITWHFRNKTEIMQAVLDDVIADIDRAAIPAIRAEATLPERARAVVREMVRGYIGETQAGMAMVGFWSRIRSDPVAASLNAALFARYRGYCSDLVRIGQQRGAFRADADADAVGAVLVALVLGITMQHLFDPVAMDVQKAITSAGDAVVDHLEGLEPAR